MYSEKVQHRGYSSLQRQYYLCFIKKAGGNINTAFKEIVRVEGSSPTRITLKKWVEDEKREAERKAKCNNMFSQFFPSAVPAPSSQTTFYGAPMNSSQIMPNNFGFFDPAVPPRMPTSFSDQFPFSNQHFEAFKSVPLMQTECIPEQSQNQTGHNAPSILTVPSVTISSSEETLKQPEYNRCIVKTEIESPDTCRTPATPVRPFNSTPYHESAAEMVTQCSGPASSLLNLPAPEIPSATMTKTYPGAIQTQEQQPASPTERIVVNIGISSDFLENSEIRKSLPTNLDEREVVPEPIMESNFPAPSTSFRVSGIPIKNIQEFKNSIENLMSTSGALPNDHLQVQISLSELEEIAHMNPLIPLAALLMFSHPRKLVKQILRIARQQRDDDLN